MKSTNNIYTKKMSSIADLQDEAEIVYSLLETAADDRRMYGIRWFATVAPQNGLMSCPKSPL
jgi:hypothetical protein